MGTSAKCRLQDKIGYRLVNKGANMAKINCYLISCSSDAELDARRLFVWGGFGNVNWCAETKKEAQKQIMACIKKNKCLNCDSEIHQIDIERTYPTNKQMLSNPQKP